MQRKCETSTNVKPQQKRRQRRMEITLKGNIFLMKQRCACLIKKLHPYLFFCFHWRLNSDRLISLYLKTSHECSSNFILSLRFHLNLSCMLLWIIYFLSGLKLHFWMNNESRMNETCRFKSNKINEIINNFFSLSESGDYNRTRRQKCQERF